VAGVRALSRNGFWGMLDAASGRKVSSLHAPRCRRFHLCCSAAAAVGAVAAAIIDTDAARSLTRAMRAHAVGGER
jgi:hypothetical protein